jgi:uncharacterized protein (TIGR03435 family)
MRDVVVGLFIVATALARPSGQSPLPSGADPRFEVASVKPSLSELPVGGGGTGGGTMGRRGQRFVAVNMPLRDIIRYAFELEPFQTLEGGPRWLDDRYDITALIPGPPTAIDPSRGMLRTLLAERFKLSTRRMPRTQPVFGLVLARDDGRLGPGLKPSTEKCDGERVRPRQADDVPRDTALSAEDSARLLRPVCDMTYQPFRAALHGNARTMDDLARVLSRLPSLGARVVDRTELTGRFDFDLTFTPERGVGSADPAAARDERSAPSLFVAVQEQLGLRLDRRNEAVDVIVIDGLERPTPD